MSTYITVITAGATSVLRRCLNCGQLPEGVFTMASEIELLRNAPVFGGIGNSALRLIVARSGRVRVREGAHFFVEGEPGDTMYVLLQGHASVYRSAPSDDKLVRFLDEGDCFGEMALLDLAPRSASVMALEHCTALAVTGAALEVLHHRHLEAFALLQMNIARELSRRLRQSDDALLRCALGEPAPGGALLLRSA